MRFALSLIGLLALPAMAEDAVVDPTLILTEVDGVQVTYTATIDLSDPTAVIGQAPCNGFRAARTGELPSFTLGPIMSTMMACEDLEAETGFLALLAQMDTATFYEFSLVLTGGGHEMHFEPVDEDAG